MSYTTSNEKHKHHASPSTGAGLLEPKAYGAYPPSTPKLRPFFLAVWLCYTANPEVDDADPSRELGGRIGKHNSYQPRNAEGQCRLKNRDYLEYLRPFVLEVLPSLTPNSVEELEVCNGIRETFGLHIPSRVIAIVLKRLVRAGYLKRENHKYHFVSKLPPTDVGTAKAAAQRHIDSVIREFIAFTQTTGLPITDEAKAISVGRAPLGLTQG